MSQKLLEIYNLEGHGVLIWIRPAQGSAAAQDSLTSSGFAQVAGTLSVGFFLLLINVFLDKFHFQLLAINQEGEKLLNNRS